MERQIVEKIDRWKYRQMERQIDEKIDRWKDRYMERQIDRKIDRQIERQIDRKIDRLIDRCLYITIIFIVPYWIFCTLNPHIEGYSLLKSKRLYVPILSLTIRNTNPPDKIMDNLM